MPREPIPVSVRPEHRLKWDDKPVRFISATGVELVFPKLGRLPHFDKPHHLLLSGFGLIGGDASTSSFYIGLHNPVHNEATFWLATEAERRLLTALHERHGLAQAAYEVMREAFLVQDGVWANRQDGIEYAVNAEDWSAGSAKYVFSRLAWAKRRLGDSCPFGVRFYPPEDNLGPDYELRGVLEFIGDGNTEFKLQAKSKNFIRDLLHHKLRS